MPDGLFTIPGITMIVCGVFGFTGIVWLMSFAHGHDESHDDSSKPKSKDSH